MGTHEEERTGICAKIENYSEVRSEEVDKPRRRLFLSSKQLSKMDSDPTTQFFTKLKKVVGTMESETAKLKLSFENRHNDEDRGE